VDQHVPLSVQGPDGPSVGAFQRPRQALWVHALLFVLTLGSTTLCGGLYFGWTAFLIFALSFTAVPVDVVVR
jgi:hypothetical protein